MELVPSRYLKKNSNLNFAVDAFLSPLLFILYAIWGKKRKTTCATRKSRTNFFSLILMGPIPFFLTFRAELKKVSNFWIRPIITDSTGNFSFGQEDGEGPAAALHTVKNRLFCFWRYLNGTNSILPNFSSWVEKNIEKNYSANIYGFYGKFWFWPWWWWGTTHTVKNRKISNCK